MCYKIECFHGYYLRWFFHFSLSCSLFHLFLTVGPALPLSRASRPGPLVLQFIPFGSVYRHLWLPNCTTHPSIRRVAVFVDLFLHYVSDFYLPLPLFHRISHSVWLFRSPSYAFTFWVIILLPLFTVLLIKVDDGRPEKRGNGVVAEMGRGVILSSRFLFGFVPCFQTCDRGSVWTLMEMGNFRVRRMIVQWRRP